MKQTLKESRYYTNCTDYHNNSASYLSSSNAKFHFWK